MRYTAEEIRSELGEINRGLPVAVFESTDSTNTRLKEFIAAKLRAQGTAPEAVLFAALSQTSGRGRFGRRFFSENAGGIYMSMSLALHRPAAESLFITSAAAVAVCRVLERYIEEIPRIKWVNDIWLGDRKLCGILTEAVAGNGGTGDYAVIGIGININTDPGVFPPELKDTAVSACVSDDKVPALIAGIADELRLTAVCTDSSLLIDEYRSRSMIIGREVTWEHGGRQCGGYAADIDESGRLIVETDEGRTVLDSGLVSVRPLRTSGRDTALCK